MKPGSPRAWGAAALACVAWVIVASPGTALAGSAPRLPDLDQAPPGQIGVSRSGAHFHLGFYSAVDNVGDGPLIVRGHRTPPSSVMSADQRIRHADGSTETIPNVGRLRYVYSPDHQHWHYIGFDRFLLRRAADGAPVGRDRKTGFCLGDRYNTDPNTVRPHERRDPVYVSECGLGEPQLGSVTEGISVGWGDLYEANLEGQYVDITRLPAGRYFLIHRVNANRALAETRYTNDSASAQIDLSWPNGFSKRPRVRVVSICAQGARCP